MAGAFLFLHRFKLPSDYFDTRAQALQNITVKDVQKAVHTLMNADDMFILRVGRVQTQADTDTVA